MHGTVHGVLSLGLICGAAAVGLIAMAAASLPAGAAYLALAAAAVPVVLFAYCAKCPARQTGCRHVIPGRLTRYLPSRKAGPYSLVDYGGLALSVALVVAAPQSYLWRSPPLLALFWGLVAAGVWEIRGFVCTGCGNHRCPLQKPGAGDTHLA